MTVLCFNNKQKTQVNIDLFLICFYPRHFLFHLQTSICDHDDRKGRVESFSADVINFVRPPPSQVTLTGTARQQDGRMFSQTSPVLVGQTQARTRYCTTCVSLMTPDCAAAQQTVASRCY